MKIFKGINPNGVWLNVRGIFFILVDDFGEISERHSVLYIKFYIKYSSRKPAIAK